MGTKISSSITWHVSALAAESLLVSCAHQTTSVYPIVWKLNYGETVVRPVHVSWPLPQFTDDDVTLIPPRKWTGSLLQVLDVAQALSNLTFVVNAPGQTYNLPGPHKYTHNDILDIIASLTYNPPSKSLTLPKSIVLTASKIAQYAWWPILSPDEVERRYLNDSDVNGDWEALGVAPEELENIAITYVRRFRNAYVWASLPSFSHDLRSKLTTTLPTALIMLDRSSSQPAKAAHLRYVLNYLPNEQRG